LLLQPAIVLLLSIAITIVLNVMGYSKVGIFSYTSSETKEITHVNKERWTKRNKADVVIRSLCGLWKESTEDARAQVISFLIVCLFLFLDIMWSCGKNNSSVSATFIKIYSSLNR
jgi:hypothetical protein